MIYCYRVLWRVGETVKAFESQTLVGQVRSVEMTDRQRTHYSSTCSCNYSQLIYSDLKPPFVHIRTEKPILKIISHTQKSKPTRIQIYRNEYRAVDE